MSDEIVVSKTTDDPGVFSVEDDDGVFVRVTSRGNVKCVGGVTPLEACRRMNAVLADLESRMPAALPTTLENMKHSRVAMFAIRCYLRLLVESSESLKKGDDSCGL